MTPPAPGDLARSLVRPVVQGALPLRLAYTSILNLCLQRERDGGPNAIDTAREACRWLNQLVQLGNTQRQDAIAAIRWKVGKLADADEPSNVIRCHAHDIAAFQYHRILSEPDVDAIVADKLDEILARRRWQERQQNGGGQRPRRRRG